jgi:hypothetical protein
MPADLRDVAIAACGHGPITSVLGGVRLCGAVFKVGRALLGSQSVTGTVASRADRTPTSRAG